MKTTRTIFYMIGLSLLFVFGGITIGAAQEEVVYTPTTPSASSFESVAPDLFTGAMSYSIPITVPAGRNGLQPKLVLQYRSNNGDGWIGVGWQLEVGAIERSLKNGVKYDGDSYVFRTNGGALELINIGNGEYKAKIENAFYKFTKTSDAGWIVTDKKGTKYFLGQTPASQQVDSNRIFKWCLDKIEDTFGNYITFSYAKDQNQIYLDEITYNVGGGLSQPHYIKFHRELRPDTGNMYTTGYRVNTAYRLKTIAVKANGYFERAYKLVYDVDPNSVGDQASYITNRSVLTSVQQFGSDADVDSATGQIRNESTATKLPAQTFQGQPLTSSSFSKLYDSDASTNASSAWTWQGDFDGDGRTDVLGVKQSGINGQVYINYARDNGFETVLYSNVVTNTNCYYWNWVGDFNGDGRTDILAVWYSGLTGGAKAYVNYKTDTGFNTVEYTGLPINTSYPWNWIGDFDGDGKTEFLAVKQSGLNGAIYINHFTDSGVETVLHTNVTTNTNCYYWNWVGDFNGDGKTDILAVWYSGLTGGAKAYVNYKTDTGFNTVEYTGLPINTSYPWNWIGDFNGDGRTDFLAVKQSGLNGAVYINHFTDTGVETVQHNNVTTNTNCYYWNWVGDFNGDGKTDIFAVWTSGLNSTVYVDYSTGAGFKTTQYTNITVDTTYTSNKVGDFNGDGRADFYAIWTYALTGAQIYININESGSQDYLREIYQGTGSKITVDIKSSTKNAANLQLPFFVPVLSSISTCDNYDTVNRTCKNDESITNYTHNSGFFHLGEKDFRGFNYAKVTGPTGTITETWFHQGNDVGVIDENATKEQLKNLANVNTGYMKGKPYRNKVSAQGITYSNNTTEYYTDKDSANTEVFFNPPKLITTIIDNKTTKIEYDYDAHGNVILEKQYGDDSTSDDDRTIIRAFSNNESAWIVGLPLNESVHQGIGTMVKKAETTYYYDGVTDCSAGSTNQNPDKGKLTRIVRWNSTGASPEVKMAYNDYGNIICSSDPNGNVTTVAYDSTNTLPTIVTNPKGHQIITEYYYGDTANGLFGQIKTVTDPNNAVITTEYDALSRKKKVTAPDNSQTTWEYSYGIIGSTQYVKTTSSVGLSSWNYFDGLGRTIIEKKTGPDSKFIIQKIAYDARGLVWKKSMPYFEGESEKNTIYTYDSIGRMIKQDRPDGTKVESCYTDWISVSMDANQHKKRETKNALGRLIKVEEYDGMFTNCDTTVGTPYATTTYSYDILGNLVQAVDALGNVTTMSYDNLGRQISITDPDMGTLYYFYDNAGNLTSQVDATGQWIYFQYDVLNRLRQKDYTSQSPLGEGDVVYEYDGATSNGVGRLTFMDDYSGTKTIYYDFLGRVTQTVRLIDGLQYATSFIYDSISRVTSINYPNNSLTVSYAYNGPFVEKVSESAVPFVQYFDYNAFGQPTTVSYRNGVTTNYSYSNSGNPTCSKDNYMLCSTTTTMGSNVYQDIMYEYDNTGNITAINDSINENQSFVYDGLNRLITANGAYGTILYDYNKIGNMIYNGRIGSYQYNPSGSNSVRPHAVIAAGSNNTYNYDSNGNMISGAGRVIVYDPENRPITITNGASTSEFYYDGVGERIKKNVGTATTIYIGNIYECENGVCSKYIFVGDKRVVKVSPDDTLYYHTDHLGSSSVVTNAQGLLVENIAYYPYGETRLNDGTVNVSYKFTGKEFDDSTGLYFYGARYYDPILGRFVSADTMVPDPTNPQTLNRYTYTLNNPLIYTDPSGHWSIKIGGERISGNDKKALGYLEMAAGIAIMGVAAYYGVPAGEGELLGNAVYSTGAALIGDGASRVNGGNNKSEGGTSFQFSYSVNTDDNTSQFGFSTDINGSANTNNNYSNKSYAYHKELSLSADFYPESNYVENNSLGFAFRYGGALANSIGIASYGFNTAGMASKNPYLKGAGAVCTLLSVGVTEYQYYVSKEITFAQRNWNLGMAAFDLVALGVGGAGKAIPEVGARANAAAFLEVMSRSFNIGATAKGLADSLNQKP